MATKANRGTKRTCAACNSPFYDLNRETIVCPMCGAEFVLEEPEIAEDALASAEAEPESLRVVKRPAKVPEVDDDDDEEVDEAADLVDIEEDDEEVASSDDDDTFLEEEEDSGSDVSGIISGPVSDGDDEDS